MNRKFIPLLTVISLFGILFMLNYTSPLDVGVLGILIFFVLIFNVLFGVILKVLEILQKILRDKKGVLDRGEGVEVGRNKRYMLATLLAFGPILVLLVMRARGAVDFAAGMGIFTVIFLGCLWVYKKA